MKRIIYSSHFLWSCTIYSIKKIKICGHHPLVSPVSLDCGMLGFILWMLWKSIIVRFCFQGCQTIFWLNFSPFGTQLLSCWQKLRKYEHIPPFQKKNPFAGNRPDGFEIFLLESKLVPLSGILLGWTGRPCVPTHMVPFIHHVGY